MNNRPRRPELRPELPELLGDADPAERTAAAHATAAAVLQVAHDDPSDTTTQHLINLVDQVGVEEVAQLWQETDSDTLPGTLWSLYLLRTWTQRDADEAARLFAAGRRVSAVSTAIAGVAHPPGPKEIAALGDAVLASAFTGDFATSLERAAAFCRVIAAGRAHIADDRDEAEGARQTRLAKGNLRMADELEHAAALWRRHELH